ncbi:RNA methyltransferase, partial [Enterococcus faecalis]
MKEITSTKNNQLKEWKKLHKKKYREELNQYIIEGFHLVEEAVKANADVQWILFNQRGQQEWGTGEGEQKKKKKIWEGGG